MEAFFAAGPARKAGHTAFAPRRHPGRAWRFLAGLAALVALAAGLATAALFWSFRNTRNPAGAASDRAPGTKHDLASAGRHQIGVMPAHADRVRSVAVSPDGRYLASGGYDKKVQLWYLPDYREAGLFIHHSPVRFVGFSLVGDRLVFGGENGVVVVDPESGRVIPDLRVPQQDLSSAALLSGTQLFSADGSGVVGEWNLETGRPVREFRMNAVIFAAFSRDGRYLLSSSGGVKVHFCDVRTAKTILLLEGHTGPVRCVALSSNAQRALSGGDDESVRLGDLRTAEQIHRFTGHVGAVRCVAFSPDNARALSGGDDGTLRLWELGGNRQLLRIEGHMGAVWSVAFFPDGTRAVSGGADGTVRLWDLRPQRERGTSSRSGTSVTRSTPDRLRGL